MVRWTLSAFFVKIQIWSIFKTIYSMIGTIIDSVFSFLDQFLYTLNHSSILVLDLLEMYFLSHCLERIIIILKLLLHFGGNSDLIKVTFLVIEFTFQIIFSFSILFRKSLVSSKTACSWNKMAKYEPHVPWRIRIKSVWFWFSYFYYWLYEIFVWENTWLAFRLDGEQGIENWYFGASPVSNLG